MRRLRRVWSRIRGRRNDFQMELQAHLSAQTDDFIRAGYTPEEAHRQAVLKFGSVVAAEEAWRDQARIPQIDSIWRDVRFAWSSFRKRPALTAVLIASLAIGIGVNATNFTWLKAVYWNPLPGVRNARQLVSVNASFSPEDAGYSDTYSDLELFREHVPAFGGLFAHEMWNLSLSDGKFAQMTWGGIVSGNYFDVLGTRMQIGRGFLPREDSVQGRDPVVVLSNEVWRSRFHADPGITGRTIYLNRVPFTVIGVAEPGFLGAYGGLRQDFWIPMHMQQALDRDHRDEISDGSMFVQLLGRPRPGAGLKNIQAELDALAPQMRKQKGHPNYRPVAYPLHESQRGLHSGIFELVRILAIAAALILLLACVNGANLLLGRASERSREIAIRLSLGASRSRIIRQLLTESLLIAALAGMASLAIVFSMRNVPLLLSPPNLSVFLNLSIDWRVLLFLTIVIGGSSVLFGLLPALETTRLDVAHSLKEGALNVSVGRKPKRFRSVLVMAQVALAITSLFGAAIFLIQLRQITSAPRGFDSAHVLTAETDLLGAGYSEPQGEEFFHESLARISQLPGVISAGWTTFLPMSGSGGSNSRPMEVSGLSTPPDRPLSVVVDTATPGFLSSLQIPIVKGRDFDSSDTAQSLPVLLVNEAFVAHYLPGRDAVGARIKISKTWRVIAGVYRDYTYRQPAQPTSPSVLLPMTQDYNTDAILLVRTQGRPEDFAPELRALFYRLNPAVPVANVMTMQENVNAMFIGTEAEAGALMFFAAIACMLAAIGTYAVLSAFVAVRQREFGIRMAIGALPGDVRIRVIRHSATAAGVGCLVGLLLAWGLSRVLTSQMYGITGSDLRPYAASLLAIVLIVAVSTVLPARRASRLNLTSALRME